MWKIFRNLLCFGCESEHFKSAKGYTSLEAFSDYPSSSDVSEEMNNGDVIKSNQIPKPSLSTNRVQPPPDIEVIDESLIIADFVYGFHDEENTMENNESTDLTSK